MMRVNGSKRLHAFATALGLFLSISIASAADIFVDDDATNDPGPGDRFVSDPLEDGSRAHPYDEIQEAIDAASTGDTITVLPGTYCENISFNYSSVTLRSQDPANAAIVATTTISGACNVDTVVLISGGSPTIDGFTIEDGSGRWVGAELRGGGMYLSATDAIIRRCIVHDHELDYCYGSGAYVAGGNPVFDSCTIAENVGTTGGGIFVTDCDPTFTGCIFDGCDADGSGGGIYATALSGPMTVTSCKFIGCTAQDKGGGIFADDGVSAQFLIDEVTSCYAPVGGGVYADQYGTYDFNACTFTANSAGTAGGIWLHAGVTATLLNTTFDGNAVDFDGGGVLSFGAELTVVNCNFHSNSADRGGGLAIIEDTRRAPHITATTFTTNTAASTGGGMWVLNAWPELGACTFTGNTSAGFGGGIAFDDDGFAGSPGTPVVDTCVLRGNSAPFGGGISLVDDAAPTIVATLFGGLAPGDGNTALGGGGAIFNNSNEAVTVQGCSFQTNSAPTGGAIVNQATLTVVEADFMMNESTAGGGAAIRNEAVLKAVRCTFASNFAAIAGGGVISFGATSTFQATRCTFTQNAGAGGGAGVAINAGTGTLDGCLFYGNQGATTIRQGGGVVEVHDCTIADNLGVVSGGIENAGGGGPATLLVTNSILWNNTGAQFVGPRTVVFSDVTGGAIGAGNIDSDPFFAEPAVGNYRLTAGSPCIDAGDTAAVPPMLTLDLGGDARLLDDPTTADTGIGGPPLVDMGADEFRPMLLGDFTGDGKVDGADLGFLLGAWGIGSTRGDLNGDGSTDGADLGILLGAWTS